jgi:hypothetical protein
VEFFRLTLTKLLIAIVLTAWPYVASIIFLLHAGDGSIFTDKIVQLSFWEHTWHWTPFYLIVQLFPDAVNNNFWQSNIFLFFIYPLVRFSIRYIVACAIVYFVNKRLKKRNQIKETL